MSDTEKNISLPPVITVSDFAQRLELGAAQVVGELMKNGVMATVNEQIDFDTAEIIAAEFGFTATPEAEQPEDRPSQKNSEAKSSKQSRPQAGLE